MALVVEEVLEGVTATQGTTHTITLPTPTAGQLLLIIGARGVTVASVNAHASLTELLDEAQAHGLYVAYRWMDGTEPASYSLNTSASTRFVWFAYRISGAENPATQAPQIGTTSSGTSATPDPPASVTPGSSKEYLFVAFANKAGEEADDDSWANTSPTGYTPSPPRQKSGGVAGTNLGAVLCAAERTLITGAAEDPGTFAVDVSVAWRAQTVMITPAAVAAALDAQPGSYALTGAAASVPAARQVTATAGSYAVTGAAASVPAARVVSASPGAYTLTGSVADLVFTGGGAAFSLNAEPGSYTITGAANSPVAGRSVNASAGVYAITGSQAGLLATRVLGALPGAYTVTGSDATLSLPGAYTLDAAPGSYTLTGSGAGAVAGHAINAAVGSYALTGAAAGLLPIRLLVATPGTYALVGSTAGLASSGEEAVTLYFFDQPSPSTGFDAEWLLAGAVYGVTVYGASTYGGTANTRFDAPTPAKVLV